MKTKNQYQEMLSQEFFDKTPKAVFAALAVSLSFNHQNVDRAEVEGFLKNEWLTLHDNGIVPQKPGKLK